MTMTAVEGKKKKHLGRREVTLVAIGRTTSCFCLAVVCYLLIRILLHQTL